MTRRMAIGCVVAAALAVVAGIVWVRSVLAQDAVREALATQIAAAIGHPVTVESIGATIFPRVTVRLGGVSIGQPVRLRVETLRVGTDLRALLSRRIVHGTVHLDGGRLELPLPPIGSATPSTEKADAGSSPLEIVSIDEVVLNGVEIVSGGRTLRGDISLVPNGEGARLRSLSLTAEDTRITGSGDITRLAGPAGRLALQASSIDLLRLIDFLAAFSGGAAARPGAGTTAAGSTPPVDLSVALEAGRATLEGLVLDSLRGRARVTPSAIEADRIEFGAFGGRYTGQAAVALEATSIFRLTADVSSVDVAALTAFAGIPNVVSGRLAGRVDVGGPLSAGSGLVDRARGTARIEIRDGIVKRLGLVRAVVLATSMRADGGLPTDRSTDEPFSRLGATLRFADGGAYTEDLAFESADLLMHAAGAVRLDGSEIDLRGRVQLSEALTRRAGRDLVRYTQEDGRVTLPVTIAGAAADPSVQVDTAGVATRALKNAAREEIKRRLGGLFRR